MTKLDPPEISTRELMAEVRKAIARQALKSDGLATDAAALEYTSAKENSTAPLKNNSTSVTSLSTKMDLISIRSQLLSLLEFPKLELQSVFKPNDQNEYHINDLLKFHDVNFLNAAYRAIMKRDPDPVGYSYYLEHLREGHLDKVDILASLRFSAEGRDKNVQIKGLALPTLIRRLGHLPVIGYPIRLGIGLLRLPVLIHRMRQHEAYSFAQNQKVAEHTNEVAEHANEVAEHVDSVNDVLARYLSNLSAAITDLLIRSELQANQHGQMTQQLETLVEQQQKLVVELRQEFRAQIDENRASAQEQTQHLIQEQQSLLESSTNDIRAKITEAESTTRDLRARIVTVESSANDLRVTIDKLESSTNTTQAEIEKVYRQLQHARTELALQGRRMALILEEARSRLPGPFDQQQLKIIAPEEQHKLDALYAEIEDEFRGSPEEIKERFRTYLPHIKSLEITNELPIVDLGCGRGEWLELLKEEGFKALGVDTNRVFLDSCRGRGLDVRDSDALAYLRGLTDYSLSAITGFHIIEHLPIEVLIKLLDEIVRVLRPGGAVIFETPNPENVLVGSNYFYFDPTHRNPLPSLLMKLLLESRGLHGVEVKNLHPADRARIAGNNDLTTRFNELFYGPMDYAIVGWKVSE